MKTMRLNFLLLSLSVLGHLKLPVVLILTVANLLCFTAWSMFRHSLILVLIGSLQAIFANTTFACLVCSKKAWRYLLRSDCYERSVEDRDVVLLVTGFLDLLLAILLFFEIVVNDNKVFCR